VAGVAILGSVVNGQLTVHLTQRLVALGIPKEFRSLVISAVTTGSIGSQARGSAGKGNASIQEIINKVVSAAYGAFGHGLDLALTARSPYFSVGRGGLVHRLLQPCSPGRSGR
jgi:hypothetical protein